MTEKARFDLYLNTRELTTVHAAEVVLQEKGGVLSLFGFRYTSEYLSHSQAFSLDPVQLPLTGREFKFECRQGVPGILDDYLPDDWGRKVLAQLAFYRDRRKLNRHSCIDTIAILGDSRIGSLQWVGKGEEPKYRLGCDISQIQSAEYAAQTIDHPEQYAEKLDEMSLLYLANAGTGVGGARPKALVADGCTAYLAKFNRLSQDTYNNACVELACLSLAKEAGLPDCRTDSRRC